MPHFSVLLSRERCCCLGDSFVQCSPFRPLGPWCTVRAFSCLFASFPVFSYLFLLFLVFSAFWPSCVQCMSFRPLSVGFPGGGCAAPSWFVRGFGGCCDLLCPVGFLVVWNAPFSVGAGVGSRVFWRLAGVVFWPRLFWLCVIGTRILLRFARKKKYCRQVSYARVPCFARSISG